jgi:hypothetical protein
MSGDDKFHVVGEVKVGTLDDNLRLEWDRLCVQQRRLVALQETHEEALDAFWDALQRQFGHHAPPHDATQHFRVSEEGDVYLEHCKCPVCQAGVHGLTVSETVEEMYKNDLIPHQAIDFVRARAKHIDTHQEMRKKMLN